MRIFLISTFTLAIYAGQADAQPPAEDTRPAATQEESASAPPSQARDHARAAQRRAAIPAYWVGALTHEWQLIARRTAPSISCRGQTPKPRRQPARACL